MDKTVFIGDLVRLNTNDIVEVVTFNKSIDVIVIRFEDDYKSECSYSHIQDIYRLVKD